MPKDIRELLKRRKLKGEEVGRALILTLVDANVARSRPQHKPLFSEADLRKLEHGLSSTAERTVYGEYIDLYNALINEYNTAEAYIQQAESGMFRMAKYVNDALSAEEAQRADIAPAILTEKQARDYRAAARDLQRAVPFPSYALLLHVLRYYLAHSDAAPPDVAQALAEAEHTPLLNDRILTLLRNGGMPDDEPPGGIHGDRAAIERWRVALQEEHARHRELFSGAVSPGAFTPKAQEMLQKLQALYLGETEESDGSSPDAGEPHILPDPLMGLDFLKNYDPMGCYSDAPHELADDFPMLCDALLADIQAHMRIILPGPAKWGSPLTTLGALADTNAYDLPGLVNPTLTESLYLLPKHKPQDALIQALAAQSEASGVAVLQEDSVSPGMLDERGYYAVDTTRLSRLFTGLAELSENQVVAAHARFSSEGMLLPAMRYLQAYNILLNLLSAQYDIPEIAGLGKDLEPLTGQAEALNALLVTLNVSLCGTKEVITHKREVLHATFPLLDIAATVPTQAAQTALATALAQKDALRGASLGIYIQMLIEGSEGRPL